MKHATVYMYVMSHTLRQNHFLHILHTSFVKGQDFLSIGKLHINKCFNWGNSWKSRHEGKTIRKRLNLEELLGIKPWTMQTIHHNHNCWNACICTSIALRIHTEQSTSHLRRTVYTTISFYQPMVKQEIIILPLVYLMTKSWLRVLTNRAAARPTKWQHWEISVNGMFIQFPSTLVDYQFSDTILFACNIRRSLVVELNMMAPQHV